MHTNKICFIADKTIRAQRALQQAVKMYKTVSAEKADTWVVFGGDGFLLRQLHLHIALKNPSPPIFGINCGGIGFLMNELYLKNIPDRVQQADSIDLNPLHMEVIDVHSKSYSYYAVNEVSLLRNSSQAAHLKVSIDGATQLQNLVCDGILVATPAGSTAYNYSAHGPIIPLRGNLLALTPLCPFRPRRWRGALLPQTACVEIQVLDPKKRPVSAVADFNEVQHIHTVRIQQASNKVLKLLFDKESNLEKRILKEQFGGS